MNDIVQHFLATKLNELAENWQEFRSILKALRLFACPLLAAITKARGWIDDIRLGAIGSFAEIAEREAQGERHIRLLAPLAFLSPRIIAAIVDGTAPADLTVTGLAKALPYSWAEQEESVGL